MIFLVFFLFTFIQSQQNVPLRKGGYGFSIGNPKPTLHIEFVLDFLCKHINKKGPDSKQSYNILMNVQKEINFYNNNIKLTFHHNPLPYHIHSAKIHQVFFFILERLGESAAKQFINFIFYNQSEYEEEKFLGKSFRQFQKQFAITVAHMFKIQPTQILNNMKIGSPSHINLFNHYKYTVIHLGAPASPQFFINGLLVDRAEDYNFEDWMKLISQLKD